MIPRSGALDNIVRAVSLSVGVQVAAKVMHLGLNGLVTVAVIRYLGPNGYGDYVFAFSFSTLVGALSELGLSRIAVREMAKDAAAAPAILGTTILARAALAVLSSLLAQGILVIMGARPFIHLAVGVASMLMVTEALLNVSAVFQVRLAMQYDALVELVTQVFKAGVLLFLMWESAGLIALIAGWVAAGLFGVIVANLAARRVFHMRLRVELRRLPGLLKEALPFGVAVLLAITYLKLDGVLIAVMRTPAEVGLYGAAYKPIEFLLLASAVLTYPLFPLLVRWQGVDPERYTIVYRRGMELLLAYGLPICVAFLLLAEPLVQAAYGPGFEASALPLRLLGVSLVFLLFHVWQAHVLLAAGRQEVPLMYNLAGLALNVPLNLVLIARLGYIGAAVAALATSVFIAACAGIASQILLDVTLGYGKLLRLLGANGALAATIGGALMMHAHWLAAGLLGCAIYPFLLMLFGVTNLAELRLMLPTRQVALVGASAEAP